MRRRDFLDMYDVKSRFTNAVWFKTPDLTLPCSHKEKSFVGPNSALGHYGTLAPLLQWTGGVRDGDLSDVAPYFLLPPRGAHVRDVCVFRWFLDLRLDRLPHDCVAAMLQRLVLAAC